jgi:hypothetical protein
MTAKGKDKCCLFEPPPASEETSMDDGFEVRIGIRIHRVFIGFVLAFAVKV